MSSTKKINIQTKLAHPYLALMGVLIGGFVGMLSETSLNIALPSIMKAFSIETGTAQWLVTGYMLVIAIVLPLSSLLTKHFSTRGLVRFGLLIFVVGSIISALALDFAMLLTGRMIQGIGTGIILPLMFSIAMRIFPPNKLGGCLRCCRISYHVCTSNWTYTCWYHLGRFILEMDFLVIHYFPSDRTCFHGKEFDECFRSY